jgi:hypothetical protein
LYYEEHLRQIEEVGQTLTDSQLQEVVEEYGKMAIKRRAIRRRIGEFIGTEIAKRALEGTLADKLIDINRKDEKMKREFRKVMGLPEPTPTESLPNDTSNAASNETPNDAPNFAEDSSQLPP